MPVVGPKLLTNRLNRMRFSAAQQASLVPTAVDPDGNPDLIGSASAMFLQPEYQSTAAATAPRPNDNAWYRLLTFVEVPSRVNVMLGDYFGRLRLPGKVNLNGISHPEVYAGLLDEPAEADVSYFGDLTNQFAPFLRPSLQNPATPLLPAEPLQEHGARPWSETGVTAVYDAGGTASPPGGGPPGGGPPGGGPPGGGPPGGGPPWGGGGPPWGGGGPPPWGGGPPPWGGGPPPWAGGPNSPNGPPSGVGIPGGVRDRWFEFLAERDGATWMWDQENNQHTTFWIPGTPNARPFRSIGNMWKPEDSVLRTLAMDRYDGEPGTNRHWQELGSQANHENPLSVGLGVSQHQRHYLLQKVLNNSTTTSNTFAVYITVGYFRSEEVEGVIRIGERMGLDTDGDGNEQNDPGWGRRAMFLIDRSELINAWDEGSGTFDWERLVKFRVDLDIN